MNRTNFSRAAVAIGIVICSLALLSSTLAEPPELPFPDVSPEKLRPLQVKESEAIKKGIGNALQSGQSLRSDDPVLDEVLQVIGERGSILDGSSLDEIKTTEHVEKPKIGSSKRAIAAESLLKAARKLEKLGSINKTQAALVAQMRRQAVELLKAHD